MCSGSDSSHLNRSKWESLTAEMHNVQNDKLLCIVLLSGCTLGRTQLHRKQPTLELLETDKLVEEGKCVCGGGVCVCV